MQDVALHGYAAVDLFMILSGFVLAMTYVPRTPGPVWQGFPSFMAQRLARLYPLYALTTLVSLLLAWRDGTTPNPAAIASNLLMTTTNLWEVDAINGPSWSISVEITLNLAFPLFVLLCIRTRPRTAATLAALCAAALVAVSLLDHRLNGGVPGALGTLDTRLIYLRCAPEFALGMLCWRLLTTAPQAAWLGTTPPLALVIAAMLAMTPSKSLDLPFVACACLLVTGLAAERSPLTTLLGSRLPHWLGTISFSLYLWHAPALALRPALVQAATALGAPSQTTALMAANSVNLALVLLAATVSYHRFEAPLRRRLRGR